VRLAFAISPLLVFALAGCDAKTETAHDRPSRPVLVAVAHFAPREAPIALPGIVKARIEADLGFRVAGKIAERFVDSGAHVSAGDRLARLDDSDLKLQLQQAEAALAAAQAAAVQAEAESARVAALHKEGWTASSEFDRVKSANDQARAAVTQAERAVTLASNALGYATLVADADGRVSATLAETGQVVAAGTPVVRIAHDGAMEAAVAVPESLIGQVREDATVSFWALPGVSVPAHLRELAADADAATRTYAARYALDPAPPGAALGMSVTLSLSPTERSVAAVPLGAILDTGDGPTVWSIGADGVATRKRVTLAGADSGAAYIAQGVTEGEKIVALGAQKIAAGEKLKTISDLKGL